MTPASQISNQLIGGKSVAVFESHHFALIPWAAWSRAAGCPRVITIDHHCDTMEAFTNAAFNEATMSIDRHRQAAFLARVDVRNPATIESAVEDLRNDQHIDAAIRSRVIDAAFVIAPQNARSLKSNEQKARSDVEKSLTPIEIWNLSKTSPRPAPPMTYQMPDDRMIAINPVSFLRGAELVNPWPDLALESEHLGDRLRIFDQILADADAPLLWDAPFILDIDLDAFGTWRSLSPQDPTVFYRLIRDAVGITIAREEGCFNEGWQDDVACTVDQAELAILDHIRAATCLT